MLAILCLSMISLSGTALGQGRWSVEARGGAAIPAAELGEAELGTGFGFEGTVAYRVMPHLSAYGGWGWTRFATDEPFAGAEADVEETGYAFGLRFVHPIGRTDFSYMLRAGATFNHIEIEDEDGYIVGDSDHGLGWEAGAGLAFSVNERWTVTPGLRYRMLSRDIGIAGGGISVDLEYLMVDIGVSASF